MVPPEYITFYTTIATVGATLFGLIFVVISIAPENVTTKTAPVDRQVRATAAYIALLNPLVVGLFALVPHQIFGIAVWVLSWVGIINTLAMTPTLFQRTEHNEGRFRYILLLVVSLILYVAEFYIALHMQIPVPDPVWLSVLADVLIFLTIYGIVRAWELVGIRQFRIRDWFVKVLDFRKNKVQGKEGPAESGGRSKD